MGMEDTNPAENPDLEGVPDIEERAPGMDVELDQESTMAPRDHPVAAGDDPAYPVTAAEERVGESVAARAARETPDVGRVPRVRERSAGDSTERYVVGAFANRMSQTEASAVAVEADDPLVLDRTAESVAAGGEGGGHALVDPDAEGQMVTDEGEATEVTAAEEAAVRVQRDG